MDSISDIAAPASSTQHVDVSPGLDNEATAGLDNKVSTGLDEEITNGLDKEVTTGLNKAYTKDSSLRSGSSTKNPQHEKHRTVINFNHVQPRYYAENTEASSYHIFRPADQTMSSPLRVSSHFTKRDLNPKVHSRHHPYFQVNFNKVQSKLAAKPIPTSYPSSRHPSSQYCYPPNYPSVQPHFNPNVQPGYYLIEHQKTTMYPPEYNNYNLSNYPGYGPYPNRYPGQANQYNVGYPYDSRTGYHSGYPSGYHRDYPQNHTSHISSRTQPPAVNPVGSNTNSSRQNSQNSQVSQPSQKPRPKQTSQPSPNKHKPKKTKCCEHNCSVNCKKDKTANDYSHITFPKLSTSFEGSRPNQLSLVDKKVIISLLEQNVSIRYLSQHYNIPRTSIYGFFRNKEKIDAFLTQEYSNPDRKRLRKPGFESVDREMGEWAKQMRELGVPITGPMCMAKALHFHSLTGSEGSFSASEGWLRSFRARYGITFQDSRSKSLPGEKSASKEIQ